MAKHEFSRKKQVIDLRFAAYLPHVEASFALETKAPPLLNFLQA